MKCEPTAQGAQFLKPRTAIAHDCSNTDHPACIVSERNDRHPDLLAGIRGISEEMTTGVRASA
jgi:hypothetical protein